MAEKPMWEQIGSGFVQHYYQQFDSDRVKLADLYVSELLYASKWLSLNFIISHDECKFRKPELFCFNPSALCFSSY